MRPVTGPTSREAPRDATTTRGHGSGTRQARALRACAAAALTTLFAATAHTLGGGGAPAPTVLLIAVLLSLPVALALHGRRPGAARTSFAVIGSQAVYHVVFAVFGMSAAFAGPLVHVHGTMMSAAVPGASSGSTVDAAAPMMGLLEPTMLAMHAAAALVTIALLVHGERLLRAIGRTIWPNLLRRAFRALAAFPAAPIAQWRPAPVVRTVLTGVRRRGPPVFC